MATSAMQGVQAANHALLAPVRATSAAARSVATEDERHAATIPSVFYEAEGWSHERSVDHRADIDVGDYVRFTKQITEADVDAFARLSGDTNRLHLDDEFAADTRFGSRIAHGTLVSGMISAALARLPGMVIYLSQNLEFKGPVGIGTEVTARVEVLETRGDDRFRLETTVETADGETVVDGEAEVLIDPVEGEE